MSTLRIKHIFAFLSTTCLASACLSISCSKSQQTSITCTETTHLTSQLSAKNSTVVVFPLFSFTGDISPKELKIENTFRQGFATFDASIIDWNAQKHTFGVKLSIKNIFTDSVSGEFIFSLKNEPIKYESKILTVSFTPYTVIGSPESISQTTTKLPDGSDIFATFSNFHYSNISDPSLIRVSSTFSLENVIFEPTIKNLTDATFDVEIRIKNATAGIATGSLLFTYGGAPVSSAPTNLFTININSSVSITPSPTHTITQTITQGDITTVYFDNFRFDGELDMGLVRVENNFISYGSYFSSSIKNVDYVNKTFSVCVECNINEIPRTTLTSSFEFYYDDCLILTDLVEYHLNLTQAIPDYLLDITFDSTRQKYVLTKIKDDTDVEDFNTIAIPAIVNEIADDAFRNNEAINQNICFLDFDNCINLEKIGARSFEGCVSIVNELKLPSNSLNFIGRYAFKDCCNIPNTIVLPNSLQTLETGAFLNCSKITGVKFNQLLSHESSVVQSMVFKNCTSLNTIDLSVYQDIPTWISKIGNYVFSEVNSTGGQINIYKSDEPDWTQQWSSYLFSEQYCYLIGDWVFYLY